jgi:superfamily II DNA or RNA helicase
MKIDAWLKLNKDDGVRFDLLKTRLTLPNPDYTNRVKMGFKTTVFNVYGKCIECGKEVHKTYQYFKDIPKKCIYCNSAIKYIIDEVEMDRFDRIYREVGNELWVPRSLVHKHGNISECIDNTTLGSHQVDFKSKIRLGPNELSEDDQVTFVDNFVDGSEKYYGAIGQAPPGFGKTICALEVISRLKRPAAILVHKEFLMNQWADRIMDCYDIKKSDIGFVQQNVCEFEDKKIVMIMIQSLLARDYPKSMFDYFGTLCIDECHRIAAQEFRKAIVLFPARYRLGVTATPRRADKMENVFFWHIGNIVTIGEERRLKPRVKVIKTNLDLTHRDLNNMYDFRGKQNLNKVITYLIENDKRNRIIVSLIKKALKTGRKMMILSGRLDHLERLKIMMDMEMVKDGLRYTSGYYIGGMSEEERTISATRQLIFATVQMAAEGLDIPDLDTLFLVTPKSDIEQAVGRILRTYDGKKEPVVVDFSDPIEICVNMLKKRVSFYRKMRYMT